MSHCWDCPRCRAVIGDDYIRCSICGFVKESYVKEKGTSRSILNFIRSEIKEHKVAYSGKPRKNASGMHTINPYLESHGYLRESDPRYMKKFLKLRNSGI